MHQNKKIIGLIPCAGTSSRLYNIPKFILPLKDQQCSLLTNWCKILVDKGCYKIIIGTSLNNKSFIDHIIKTQLNEIENKVFVKTIENSKTMNDTIKCMITNEEYDIGILGMPDTYVDDISTDLIEKINNNNKYIVGCFLWNIRDKQIGKIGQCKVNNELIDSIIDKDKTCKYKYGWGCIIFKPTFEKYIQNEDLHIGYSMELAIKENIEIPYQIMRGNYWDCGTIDEYKEYLNFMTTKEPIFIKGGPLIIMAVYIGNDESKYQILVKCLKQIRSIYKTETIVAVDNKSLNTSWYTVAKELDIYVLYNKSDLYRYEIGAYNLALQHFRADEYILIQGTIYMNNKISEKLQDDKQDVYAFGSIHDRHHHWDNTGLQIINKYLNFVNMNSWNRDPILLWNCLYCNNLFLESLLNKGIFDLICNSKNCSCAYERILGCYISRNIGNGVIKTINSSTFVKHFLGQQ